MSHGELELLSAYLDGELDPPERTRVETHMPTCAECRETLAALRATVTDLKTLPEPAPTEQDSWALRSAISRARKPQKAWQRILFASGAVAAVLVGIIAVVHQSSNTHGGTNDTAARLNRTVPVYGDALNFDKFSAQNYFLSVIGAVSPTDTGVPAAAPAPQRAAGKSNAPQEANVFAAYNAGLSTVAPVDATTRRQLDRCVAAVRSQTQELLTPFRYELAQFDSTPAFFLTFRSPRRYEFWVMSRVTGHVCDVLYFAQS